MADALGTRTPISYGNLDTLDVDQEDVNELLKQKHDNPLLCYLVNKIDLINQELLVKITSEFYTDAEIRSAKDLLFESVTTSVRNIKRTGAEKRAQNILDMLGILHKAKPEDIPLFGVFDLSRIPPLDLNYIDVTTISQDIKKIRSEMKDYDPQANQIKVANMSKDIISMKDTMSSMGQQLAEILKHLGSDNNRKEVVKEKDPTSELLKLPPQVRRKPPTPSSSRKLPQTPLLMYSADGPGAIPKKNSMPVPEMNYSQALAHPPKLVIPKNPVSKQSKQQTPEDGKGPYQLVSYKRKPDKTMVVGKAKTAQTGLVGRGRYVSLFVSRLDPEVETDKVKAYVNDTFSVSFECERLNTRYDTYSSFKVEGYCKDPSAFYDSENWPENVLVRRFFKPKTQNNIRNGAG